jgi:dihydroorotate dehydrogenase electron transfer subunit
VDHVAPACAAQRTVKIRENTRIAEDTYRLRLDDPAMARAILPGQFLMIRPARGTDPLLGRPFALYDVVNANESDPDALDIVYLVVGRMTATLAAMGPGDLVNVWGPLGNGFGASPGGEVVFVAGGIGQTPFLALAKWWSGRQSFGETQAGPPVGKAAMLYGVRSARYLAGLDDFRGAGVDLEIATDDGSAGHHGYVTDLLTARLARGERPSKVIGCGPLAMLATLTRLTEKYGVSCDLSLENHMACGFGACFSCVAPIRQEDGSTDLRRVCVEGPIFPARSVVFP